MKSWCKLLPLLLAIPLLILAADKPDVAQGKDVFTKRCAGCHGPSGEGKEAIGKLFNVTMKNLGSKEVQSLDDATLKKKITEGNGKMKAVTLADQEATDVVAYLRTLKK